MKLIIETATNGFIIETDVDGEIVKEVIQEQWNEDESDAFVNLLCALKPHLGPSEGKYSEKRVRVIQLPGENCEEIVQGEYVEQLQQLLEDVACAIGKEKAIKLLTALE